MLFRVVPKTTKIKYLKNNLTKYQEVKVFLISNPSGIKIKQICSLRNKIKVTRKINKIKGIQIIRKDWRIMQIKSLMIMESN